MILSRYHLWLHRHSLTASTPSQQSYAGEFSPFSSYSRLNGTSRTFELALYEPQRTKGSHSAHDLTSCGTAAPNVVSSISVAVCRVTGPSIPSGRTRGALSGLLSS